MSSQPRKVSSKTSSTLVNLGRVEEAPNSDEEELSDQSEDVEVFWRPEDEMNDFNLTLEQLSRNGNRKHVYDDLIDSGFFVGLAFLNGMDNLQNFCYSVDRHGRFFIGAYVICGFLIGWPLMYMEMALGQFVSAGCYKVFDYMAPGFVGIGLSSLLLNLVVMSNDQMFSGYLIKLGQDTIGNLWDNEMQWHNCFSNYNDASCRDLLHTCQTFQNQFKTLSPRMQEQLGLRYASLGNLCYRSLMKLSDIDGEVEWQLRDVTEVGMSKFMSGETMAQHLFWNLQFTDDGVEERTNPWASLLSKLCVAWSIVYFVCLLGRKGISWFSRLAVMLALSATITLTVAVLYAERKYPFFHTDDWFQAASEEPAHFVGNLVVQAIFMNIVMLRLGQGGLIFLGAQQSFRSNLTLKSLLLFIGATILPILYSIPYMLSIDSYVLHLADGDLQRWYDGLATDGGRYLMKSGHNLVMMGLFLASLRLLKALEPFVILLYSVMGLALTLANKIVRAQILISAVVESHSHMGSTLGRYISFQCTICLAFLLMFPLVMPGGFELMLGIDDLTVPMAGLFIVICELVCVSWFYGHSRFMANIITMSGIEWAVKEFRLVSVVRLLVVWFWKFAIPVLLVAAFVAKIALGFRTKLIAVDDPPLVLAVALLVPIPAVFMWRLIQEVINETRNVKSLRKPREELWGPRNVEYREAAKEWERRLRAH